VVTRGCGVQAGLLKILLIELLDFGYLASQRLDSLSDSPVHSATLYPCPPPRELTSSCAMKLTTSKATEAARWESRLRGFLNQKLLWVLALQTPGLLMEGDYTQNPLSGVNE
jgi:hypothetical protein